MLKKAILGTLAAAGAGGFFFGTDAVSYVKTGVANLREAVRSEIPIDLEMERAKQEIQELIDPIRDSLKVVATQQVEIDKLRSTIETKTAALEEQEEAILSLNEDLKSGDTQFVYAGRKYTAGDVQKDLAERFNRFKVAEATLDDQQQILASREQALEANKDKLENMLSQKKDLEVRLEQLMAKMQSIELRKQMSNLAIDDSQLAKTKALISEIDKKLDVEARLLDAEGNFVGLIPVETEDEVPADISEQVTSFFSDADGDDLDAVDAKIASLNDEE